MFLHQIKAHLFLFLHIWKTQFMFSATCDWFCTDGSQMKRFTHASSAVGMVHRGRPNPHQSSSNTVCLWGGYWEASHSVDVTCGDAWPSHCTLAGNSSSLSYLLNNNYNLNIIQLAIYISIYLSMYVCIACATPKRLGSVDWTVHGRDGLRD